VSRRSGRFAGEPEPPPVDANPQVKMAYKLRTELGKAIYRLRKCTVEPVIGIIKAVLWASASSCYAAWRRPVVSGAWYVGPTTLSAIIL
jgi:hypothetical protein